MGRQWSGEVRGRGSGERIGEHLMRLRGVSFANWLRRPSHADKDPDERWLRELYPWPVLAQVDCGESQVGIPQLIRHDGASYEATIQFARWQPRHGTFKYRVLIESDGLGWHSRAFSDRYDMCGMPDGRFVTVFHTSKKEPLERIARSFFGRRWEELRRRDFRSLAVSRFLAASLVSQLGQQAYGRGRRLEHHPGARIVGVSHRCLHKRLPFGWAFDSVRNRLSNGLGETPAKRGSSCASTSRTLGISSTLRFQFTRQCVPHPRLTRNSAETVRISSAACSGRWNSPPNPFRFQESQELFTDGNSHGSCRFPSTT